MDTDLILDTPPIIPISCLESRDSIASTDSGISISHEEEEEEEGLDEISDLHNFEKDVSINSNEIKSINAELEAEIIKEVEYYFSDANVLKDAFLFKHIKRNKEGYVSLKLISSFKRVKHLCKDWMVVAKVITHSRLLEVNKEGTKVRRIHPLPITAIEPSTIRVLVTNIPMKKLTITCVGGLFQDFGDITYIRLLKPSSQLPADLPSEVNNYLGQERKPCALIEFKKLTIKNKTMLLTTNFQGMTIHELSNISINNLNQIEPLNKKLNVNAEPFTMKNFGHHSHHHNSDPKLMRRSSDSNCLSINRKPSLSNSYSNFKMSRRFSASDNPKEVTVGKNSNLPLSFIQRRFSHFNVANSDVNENILRMPRGPDGTRGFCK